MVRGQLPATSTDAQKAVAAGKRVRAAEASSVSVGYTLGQGSDDEGDYSLAQANSLNQCIYGDTQNGADITVPIQVGPYGPVDAQGYPTGSNPMVGKIGRLGMVLYDVDDKATILPPEVDWVFLGSTDPFTQTYEVPLGQLSGENDAQSTNTFSIPLDRLKPQSSVNPTGINHIHVDVDTANNGLIAPQWCVAVNKVVLRLFTDPLPVVLVHGFAVTDSAMGRMAQGYRTQYDRLQDLVRNELDEPDDTAKHGGKAAREPYVAAAVDDLLGRTGQSRVNLVGHSFGGLVARYYAFLHPDKVKNLVTLGTPNGGTRVADLGCGFIDPPWWNWLLPWSPEQRIAWEAAKRYVRSQTGPCDPGYTLDELTQEHVQAYNERFPDNSAVHYYAYAGNDSRGQGTKDYILGWISSNIISEENDTWVSVRSAFWLRPGPAPNVGLDDPPEQPGIQEPVKKYHLVHKELHDDAEPIHDTLCQLYAEACGSGSAAPNSVAPPAKRATVGGSLQAPKSSLRVGAVEDPESPSLEARFPTPIQLDPGQSVDLPLNFESAPTGIILVFSDDVADLGGSYEGNPLDFAEYSPGFNILATDLASPSDAALHLTNNGTATASAIVVTSVETTRHLLVSATPELLQPGGTATITVTLSSVLPGDALHVMIADESDQIVGEFDPAEVSSGTWSGPWTPPGPGIYQVQVSVDGSAPRAATATFSVASAAATMGSGFTEQIVDDNLNGLKDALVVHPSVNVTTAGPYVVSARLLASDGAPVAVASSGELDLATGQQVTTLRFDGNAIYKSGHSGPYRVANVNLVRVDDPPRPEDAVADLGSTQAYDVSTFEHEHISVAADQFADRGEDYDSDGFYDDLLLDANISVESAGSYSIYAELVDPNGSFVASRSAVATLSAGANPLTLAFFGSSIGRSGKSGPYKLAVFAVSSESDPTITMAREDAYTTGPYDISQFAGPDVTATITAGGPAVPLTIPAANQYGRVSFTGTSGQNVAIAASSSSMSGRLELRSPENKVLEGTSFDTTGGFLERIKLPIDGTYTIVVDPQAAGSVALRLYTVPPDTTTPITVGGAPVTVTTTTPGQNARLMFTGSVNQRVTVNLTSTAITSGSLALYSPGGALLASAPISASGAFIDPQTLPSAGTYTILADPAGALTGSATVTLRNAVADVTGTIRIGGQAVTVTTTAAGQNARLTFSGSVGDRVSAKLTSTAITAGTFSLLKPDGTTLVSTAITSSGAFLDAQTLPVRGTYTLLLDPAGAATGSMTVNLYNAADVTKAITAGGAAVTATTSSPGQNVKYTFSGSLNQRVSAKISSSGFTSGSFSLLKPDGTTLASTSITSSGAFLDVQTLPVAGTYTLLVDPSGTAVGSVTANLYSVTEITGAIVPGGAPVTVNITVPGQNARLTFSGSAGQRVSVALSNSSITAGTVSLLKPDGSTLASSSFDTSGGSIPLQQLPVGGTYSVLIDPAAANTGAVTVTVGQGPPDITGTITPGGPAVTVTITTTEQNAVLSFTGTQNQRVSLDLTNVTIGDAFSCGTAVTIRKPDGSTLASNTCVTTAGAFIDTQTLPVSGTYMILVDPQGNRTGSMTLRLYDVPADLSPTITPGGSAVTVSPGTPGQNAVLSFSGSQNQRVSLDLTNVTIGNASSCGTAVTIRKPDGSTLASNTCVTTAGAFIDTQTLPVSGTYTILVDPQGNRTGSMTLRLYDVPADLSPTITPGGSAVTVSPGTPGQNAVLSFSGSQNQRVSLDLTNVTIGTASSCGTAVTIKKPDGSTLASNSCVTTAGAFIDTQTLPVSGTYTILVDPQGNRTGSMTLRLYDVPADTNGTIVIGGDPVTVTLSTPGQNGSLVFTGSAAQNINLVLSNVTIGSSACCSAKVSILNPDGSTLVSPRFFGTSGATVTAQLALSGQHTIVIDPQGNATGSATNTLNGSGFSFPEDFAPFWDSSARR